MMGVVLLVPSGALAQAPSTFHVEATIAEGPPLSADAAAERALEANPSLERARALSTAASSSVSLARAALLPRLDLSASYTRIDGFDDSTLRGQTDPDAQAALRAMANQVTDPAAQALWLGTIDSQGQDLSIAIPRNRYGLRARLTWPVSDLFFRLLPAMEAAEGVERAREFELEVEASGIRRSAFEAYYALVQARGVLAVTEESKRQATAQRDEIEAAVRVGVLARADLLSAEARVAEVAQAEANARAGVEIADVAIRVLLNDDNGPVYGVRLGDVRRVSANAREAFANRPELKAIQASLGAQVAQARAERSRGYPRLSVYAGADYANPNPYQIPPQEEFTPSWEVGATLSWSPNDTLTSVHRDSELDAEQAATRAQIVELERAIRIQVARARAQLRAAEERIVAAEAAEVAANAAYQSRLSQVRNGTATTADLFAAEGTLNRARLDHLDAQVGVRLAATELAYAVGQL
ncbi:MAG: TolC family protein [Myxococcota bacterium]